MYQPRGEKQKNSSFFPFLFFLICTCMDNFTLKAVCFQKLSTSADQREVFPYEDRWVKNTSFFLLLLVKKMYE